MASEAEIDRALLAAAEAVVGRSLTQAEFLRLKQTFKSQPGGPRVRATRAIEETFSYSEDQRRSKTAASDDADRLINDLVNLATQLPPKKP
jgi:hypothetical protein